MKSKINSPDESCFKFATGYSIDMSGSTSIPFGTASFSNWDSSNNWILGNDWLSNLQSGSLIPLTSTFYNQIS